MESRLQHIFLDVFAGRGMHTALMVLVMLAASLGAAPAHGAEAEDLELEPLVVREPEQRKVKVDDIDSEDFEIGINAGLMHFEDFGSDTATSLRLAYHVSESFFVEGVYGRSKLGQTSFELLSGGAPLLTDEERDVTYYNVSIGWNIFPGESFVAGRWAFKGGVYLIAGAGSTEFGGDDLFTINAGAGYRFIATNWMALHLDVRDHYFESDLLGTKEGKHNIEFTGGLTFFF